MANTSKPEGKVTHIAPAKSRAVKASDATLEQMFGYFSFDPMPSEKGKLAKAA